jgi:hypothetical protein
VSNRPYYRPRQRTLRRLNLPDNLNAHLDLIGCTFVDVFVIKTELADGLNDIQIGHDDACPVIRKTRAEGK